MRMSEIIGPIFVLQFARFAFHEVGDICGKPLQGTLLRLAWHLRALVNATTQRIPIFVIQSCDNQPQPQNDACRINIRL